MFFYVFFENSIWFCPSPAVICVFFNYTPDWTIWSSKFQKFAHQSPDPSFALSQALPSIRALPSNLSISVALRPRFGFRTIRTPQILKRDCALAITTILIGRIASKTWGPILCSAPGPSVNLLRHWVEYHLNKTKSTVAESYLNSTTSSVEKCHLSGSMLSVAVSSEVRRHLLQSVIWMNRGHQLQSVIWKVWLQMWQSVIEWSDNLWTKQYNYIPIPIHTNLW